MNRSASPFASGHKGVILRWWNPKSLLNVWNSFPLKGGPLSVFTTSGIPWREKIMSRCGITVLAEVDEMTSTSGNLLYSSMTTRRYSLEGKGPARSTATSIHGPEGRVVMESGSRWAGLGTHAKHGMHDLTACSTFLSIPGNQTFSLISCFVFTIPWWEACAISMTFLRRESGMINLWSRRITPQDTESSSLNLT